ncbi:MAG: UbiA prenyltransferase family protein [Kiritimatiellae bacterium]|nr:UbiA prenyltransferase family protein [Kiritimatiellia bacterium]
MGALRFPPFAAPAGGGAELIPGNPRVWLRALRPAQWLKNAVLPAAYFFARWDPSQQARVEGLAPALAAATAILCFCSVSSGVYLINDLRDLEADRIHPIKRCRPLAAGAISVKAAAAVAALLLAIGLGGSLALPPAFSAVLGAYLLMQAAYTFALKRISYVDVFVIASGFVLRAVAGATALAVRISPWLLLCTFLLALFLALCKRRHEKILLEGAVGAEHRAALAGYDRYLLDMQIAVVAASTLVCYAIYTLSEETVRRFGTNRLGLTIPFVIFGLFRYMELVYRHDEGGRPEKVLLTDKILIATVACYLLTALIVFLSV